MKEKENEKKTLLRSSDDLIAAVEQYGFLPFQPDIIPLAVRLEESEDGIGMIFAFP